MDGCQAIHAAAEPWLQVAMDFALVTLQRPEYLVVAKYSDTTAPAPTFYQIKSRGGDRYRKRGWSEEQIQALYGHLRQPEGSARHEPPWKDVKCGLYG